MDDPIQLERLPDPLDTTSLTQARITLHSLSGHLAPKTLRLLGQIKNHQLVILVDGGSNHNFIQQPLVRELGLTTRTTFPLRIMLENCQHLQCDLLCQAVTITIQHIPFLVDLHVLPLCGVNIVLGVQWLKILGPIMIDYSNLSMTFFHVGHLVEFQGTTDPASVILTPPQLRCLTRKQGASVCFHIAITLSELPSNDYEEPSFPPQVQHILTQFATLFEEPHSLPPSRPTDHHIHLHPNSSPVNVRPY